MSRSAELPLDHPRYQIFSLMQRSTASGAVQITVRSFKVGSDAEGGWGTYGIVQN